MSKEVKVNAEGKELVLRNSAGDYAIIPKNRRAEALKMLEDKCYGCLDALVASLPKTSNEGEKEASKKVEYAQEGLEVEEEEISEEVSFGEAFAKARREKGAGQTFEWRGGTYSTNYEIEPEETQREAIEPVEVTAEAETITSSTPAPEEEADTTLSTLELQPLDTSSPEVEEEGVVEEGERSSRSPYTGNVDVDKVTAREQRDFMEEFFPRDEEGNIVEEDPISEEFSEEGVEEDVEEDVEEEAENLDNLSFKQAFRNSRDRLGAGKVFRWRGKDYTTNYKEEEDLDAQLQREVEGVEAPSSKEEEEKTSKSSEEKEREFLRKIGMEEEEEEEEIEMMTPIEARAKRIGEDAKKYFEGKTPEYYNDLSSSDLRLEYKKLEKVIGSESMIGTPIYEEIKKRVEENRIDPRKSQEEKDFDRENVKDGVSRTLEFLLSPKPIWKK